MKSLRYKVNKNRTMKVIVLVFTSLVIFTIFLVVLEKLQVIDLYTNKHDAPPAANDSAKTTSTAASAQEGFSEGGERSPAIRSDSSEGIVKDNKGNVQSIPDSSQWTISTDKAITVYYPAKSALITNGFVLSGSSSHKDVQFRLIDDVSGVISQGSVTVIGGKYSGTFSFTSKGNIGRLDVYYANEDGVESSSVSIPLRYK